MTCLEIYMCGYVFPYICFFNVSLHIGRIMAGNHRKDDGGKSMQDQNISLSDLCIAFSVCMMRREF